MKSRKIATVVFITLYVSMLLTMGGLSGIQEANSYKGVNPIVIFDIAHEQRFNNTHLQSAIQLIEEEFDADVYINEDSFTLTNLRGADLVIIPAPYIDADRSKFEHIEKQAITEFYQDGGSVLYLANPYFFEEEYRNYSSNFNYLNDMAGISLGEGDETYGSISFYNHKIALLDDFNHEYGDERFIHLTNNSLLMDHAIISGFSEINESVDSVQNLLTHTSFVQRNSRAIHVINTSQTAYELNSDGIVPFGGTREYTIMSVDELSQYDSRGISCASAVMFSDLPIEANGTDTWFEAYDNALLWKNMIAWLLKDLPQPPGDKTIPDFGLFVIIIIAAFFVLMVLGSVLYTIGKEIKRAEVSETLIKMRERDEERQVVDKEIEAAYYAEDEIAADEEPEVEEKEVDMKRVSDEIKKKPPKTRSRSERRRKR
ncbi:MAG: hypothetical protein FK733_05325 [Asgard group archaeon]|nr:hypothetical protein [Asgard group archaeon]